MNTYREIAEEIAQNLNWQDKVEERLNQILKGILWAEQQILGKSRGVKFFDSIPAEDTVEKYPLQKDFNTHSKLVFTDTQLNRYDSMEVEAEELLAYDPDELILRLQSVQTTDLAINPDLVSRTPQQSAREAMYAGKILFAIHRTADGWEVWVKPKFNGKIFIYYSAVTELPKDVESNNPSMPQRFWFGIVAGATYYLQRRVVQELAREDANKSVAFARPSREYKQEMDDVIADLSMLMNDRSEPPVMKPFEFYDKPENYL